MDKTSSILARSVALAQVKRNIEPLYEESSDSRLSVNIDDTEVYLKPLNNERVRNADTIPLAPPPNIQLEKNDVGPANVSFADAIRRAASIRRNNLFKTPNILQKKTISQI